MCHSRVTTKLTRNLSKTSYYRRRYTPNARESSSDGPVYSIPMRSRRSVSSGGLCGLASSATPLKTSNPARRKCPAARCRRSPGTSTYATTPSSEPRRPLRGFSGGSGRGAVIAQLHPQLVPLDPSTRRLIARHRVRQKDVPLVAPYPYQELRSLFRQLYAPLLDQREVEDHLVPAVSFHELVRRPSEVKAQGIFHPEHILCQRAKRLETVHLPVEESRFKDRDRRERVFYSSQVPPLRLPPLLEVRVRNLLREQAVHDDGVYPIVVEVQVRIGAPGLGDHHLLRVHYEPDRCRKGICQDVPNVDHRLIEPLKRPEEVVFGERRQRVNPRPTGERSDELGRPPLYGEDLLDVPAYLIGQAQEPQGLPGGGCIQDQGVVKGLLVVAPDHQKPKEFVLPRQRRQLLGR